MRKSEARLRAEALALSAMIATMNVMPALADTTIPISGIESSKEDEGEEGDKDKDLASPSNATPVEDDTEDDEDFEFDEELENDLETEESTENEEDTESTESEKESLGDSENESTEDTNGTEESTEDTESEKESLVDTENETKEDTSETEEIESELETEEGTNESLEEEVDLEQIQVATPSNLEKPELKPELMTLREVVYGEWNDSEDGNWQILPSEDGTCSIKPLSNAMKTGAVVIPEEVDGFTVISIGANAYASNRNITSIVVPDSIKEIGENAFKGATKIANFEAIGVEKIGASAFNGCTGLITFNTPNAVELGDGILEKCSKLKNVSIGANIIPVGTFRNCSVLTDYDFTGIETIGDNAFYGCKLLNNVSLSGVKNIGNSAFRGCTGLTNLSLNGVENIGDSAFYNTGLTSLTLTNIGTVGSSVFKSCSSLESVSLNNVGEIGEGAFQSVSSITSLTLDNTGIIKSDAFRRCTGLTELNIGSVGTIEGSAFAECSNLTNVIIDEVSGTVKEYAFNNSGVETITIGSINNAKYNSLVATEKITIDYAENLGGAKAKVIEITSGNNVMCGNYWPANYAGSSNNICETITIGDVRGTVKAFAFNSVTIDSAENVIADADVVDIERAYEITKVGGREVNITKALYLRNQPDEDYLNSWRINGQHNIEKLNISNYVGEIENNCFERSEKLHTVIINSADTIWDEAFKQCEVLTDLQLGTINKIGKEAYSNCRSLEKLETQDIGEIGDRAFIITGLKTVDLGNVNKIGFGAFYNLKNLERVNMGNVREIGEEAFADNNQLITVTMGEIYKMGAWAFERCTALESMNWTCKLETLPERAFYYDEELKSIDLGSDLKTIELKALFKCNSIKELTIPAGVDTVNLVDLCGEYDYSGEADFDNRGYKLIFLGDNTDFEIRYGEENVVGDNDDSIIINELVLPSKDSKAYQRMTSLDNTDIVNRVGGGSKNVLYHAVAKNTKATYKTGSININGVISNYGMLTPTSDGNMGKEVDWSWWSVYKDIGNEVGDSSNVGGLGTGRVIQHTIINAARIDNELIDGNTEDIKKENITITYHTNDGTENDIFHEDDGVQGEKAPDFVDIPTREDYKFIGWYTEPECINEFDKETVLESSIDLYAKWEEKDTEDDNKEKITVTFWMNDGTDGTWMTGGADKGSHPDLSPVPERIGHKFLGWYMEPECINEAREDLVMNQDTDFYAKWEEKDTENDKKEKINIIYWMNDGTDGAYLVMMDQDKGTSLNLRITPPTREGYEFIGWYQEPECENRAKQGITLESDTNVYAGWKLKDTGSGSGGGGGSETPDVKEKVTITYYMNDDTEDIFKREQIEKGDSPDMSVEPSRKGYEFIGWYYEAECENRVPDDITVEEDINVFAGWEKKNTGGNGGSGGEIPDNPDDKKEPIKVTYYENDGTPDIYKTEKIEKGDTPDTSGKPDREGYEFIGWYEDPDCKIPVDPSKPLDEDTEYYAGWKKKDTDPSGNGGGSDKPNDDNKGEDKVEKVKVTYHTNDDTDKIYKEEEIEKGGTPDTEGNPDRDKYEFTGWYLDPECKIPVDPSKPLDEDTDLYAGWKKKDTIPTGNGGSGSYSGGHGGSSTVTVVNVHEDKPEPDKTTIDENGVPKDKEERENIDTTTLDENGVPKDKAEKDSLPKTGDSRNIFMYMIAFISSLSSMMFMGMRDKMKKISTKKKD